MHSKSNVHVDYNPLKGMLVLISSLKCSTFPYAAGPESGGHSRTAWAMDTYRCQTASKVSLFVGFLISWISLPMKIGTPRIKVISQYNIFLGLLMCYIYRHSFN